MNWNKRLRKKR